MARAALWPFAILTGATLALAACEPGAGTMVDRPAGSEAPAKAQKSTRLVDRDVEAPEVFQVTDQALWDGRPSLGGVWVASPDTKDPERVIMRNPANGKFVIGALFRRERDNPGPTLQISSDAAAALGILAGAPSKLSITALRREEAPETAPTSPILDSAETVGGSKAVAGTTPDAVASGGVETMTLDAGGAAKPGAKPGKAPKTAKKPADTVAAAGAAIAAADPAAKPAPVAAAGKRIQIGIFSVEANANRAVDQLAKAGVPAEVRKDSAKGKTYWSVTARGDAAALKKIKAAGFGDAYLLK
ncbi:MAG: SPOR domain-containing protein [Paracoccaceae bacterium]